MIRPLGPSARPPGGKAFDEVIDVRGYSEIRLWIHISVEGYKTHPVTRQAELVVRFMHQFPGGSFDYEQSTIGWNNVTSYINGHVTKPIIGEKLRVLCNPRNLPPGRYRISATYLLVR